MLRARTAHHAEWSALSAGKIFTADDASNNFGTWAQQLAHLRRKEAVVLEIGSYEGRSAMFWLEHLQCSKLVCVDTFPWPEVEARFNHNIVHPYRDRVTKYAMRSADALAQLASSSASFDLIYIDGSHHLDDVLSDSELSWPLLRPSGILIWDDYEWIKPGRESDRPKPAIDRFLSQHARELSELHREYQIIVRKL